jgi:amino acid permease
MFSKTNKNDRIDAEQREQYDYARKRIKQKKGLMRHFIVFLVGSVLMLIINLVLKEGEDFFIPDWSVWAVLLWTFILLINVFNVFVMNRFMGKEWENQQLEKLKKQQETRIAQLKKQAIQDVTLAEVKSSRETEAFHEPTDNLQVKKTNPNELPPEQK